MSSMFDRVVILRTLGAAAVAAGLAAACSTAETGVDPGVDPGLDGGGGDAVAPLPATCSDSAQAGDETDVDCGGACAKCGDSKRCNVGSDCTSGVCMDRADGKRCQAPNATDGAKNGTETDIDCGGAGNPKCPDGKGCGKRDDCASDVCTAGKCATPTTADGAKNGTETDVDCGGSAAAPRCADLLACAADGDCKSDVCKDLADGKGKRCQAPSPTDTKKNGTETDVDCGGGGTNPACATGQACLVGNDCTSLGCNYLKKCAAGRSCTRRFGGDTCGLGGLGGDPAVVQQWEDCCTQAPVTPLTAPGVGVTVNIDKYQVTAGRMRAFLESVNYDVRGFVQQARAAGKIPVVPGNALGYTVLEPTWDAYLPTSFAGNQNAGELEDVSQGSAVLQPGIYTSIRNHLGGMIFRNNAQGSTGCYVGSTGGGTHAFRFPDAMQDGPMPSHGQDVYDTKSMQCIDYLVAQAFCVWDGGRLATLPEWQAAWGPTTAMPWSAETTQTPAQPNERCDAATGVCLGQGDGTYWGCRFPWATDANHPLCGLTWPATTSIEYAAYRYLYEYPKLIGNDYIVFITAPGRTRGRGPTGHADIIGGNFSITSTVAFPAAYDGTPFTANHRWTGSGSWEVHGYSRGGGGATMLLNKYGKLGLRCAHP